jgi:hypothetical protein
LSMFPPLVGYGGMLFIHGDMPASHGKQRFDAPLLLLAGCGRKPVCSESQRLIHEF